MNIDLNELNIFWIFPKLLGNFHEIRMSTNFIINFSAFLREILIHFHQILAEI